MMIGNNDRQSIREKAPPSRPAPRGQPHRASSEQPARGRSRAAHAAGAEASADPECSRRSSRGRASLHSRSRRAPPFGPWEFHTEKWEPAYIKRIDATIAALKSAGVPVIWVGLPLAARHQGDRRFVLSQRALPQPRREGGHHLCRHLGRLRRRGRPVLAARAGLRRPDPPPAHRRRRLFHQVRRAQARALCGARDRSHHQQPRPAGRVAGAGRCRARRRRSQAGRPAAAARGRTGAAADGGPRRERKS